jgi:hypothetical protein
MGYMRLNNSTPDRDVSPHVYNLLDQRLAQQGAPLHQLIRAYAAAVPAQPASPEELLNQLTAVLGKWAADPAQRVKPETALAEEHLRLMDDISKIQGPEGASRLEATLVRVVANQFARNMGSALRIPDESKLICLSDVKPVNAYSAFAQRTALIGIQPHEWVRRWVESQRDIFRNKPTDGGYLRLAQRLSGDWPAQPGQGDAFQRALATFLTGIASSTNHSHAVVVQSSLLDTFARAIRRQAQELGLDRPAVPPPAMSVC